MASQTITTSANHDEKTGRLAGEDLTIQLGSTLTINSCPHLTPMGILGDITLTAGTLHIDGRYVKEVAYSSGSGTFPTAIPTNLTWDAGASTGKIIRYDSGDGTSGVMTITVLTGTLAAADTITDGTWSATVDSVAVGFLVVYGEDQDWGSVDAQSTMRIQGDWYEVGVGTGADSQTITLPHAGHQHAVWVETGSGTGVYQIWHRVASDGVSLVYYNTLTQWGTSFESGFVFNQTFGSSTLTFGTSAAGGAPPNGAKIRIPNVHLGTTTVAAPTTEINSATLAAHVSIIAPNTNLNVEIDHLNGSSIRMEFVGTNTVTLSDSCWALATITTLINKVNATVSWDNCALINPGNATGGIAHGAAQNYVITDNVGGITINDCVFMGALNATSGGALNLITMANIDFTGTNKFVTNQQDENSCATLRGSVAVNVTAETLISLGGSLFATAGCNDWTIDEFVFGLPPGRGTTEQTVNWVNLTATQSIRISGGRKATGGAKMGTVGAFLLTDAFDTWISNFGAIDAKISGETRMTYVASIAGISSGVTLKRLYFNTLNAAVSAGCFQMLNSAANILIENCSGDYNDEIEIDGNRTLHKGVHGGSGGLGSTTGIEDDNINVIGTCFYDLFTSDTTGFVGLVFNDKGAFHASDMTVISGTPFFNGLGDLVMNSVGDQVEYVFPYWILGHTGFANTTPGKTGVNAANISAEYQIDTGSGFGTLVNGAGNWDSATGAKLNAETISASGFKIKFRLTTTTGTSQSLNGFVVYTTTTIADQKANLYPLSTVDLTVNVKDNAGNNIENAQVAIYDASTLTELMNEDTNSSGVATASYEYVSDASIIVRIRKSSSGVTKYVPYGGLGTITSTGFSTTIALDEDSIAASSVNATISGDWAIDTTNKTIKHSADTVVYTVNELYTWLMDTFDESSYMDDANPMTAQTPTEYTLKSGWFIDNTSFHYLSGGAVQTEGQGSNNVQILTVTGGTYNDPVPGDITKTVVAGATSIGPLLDYEIISAGVSSKWYVRDTRTTPAQIASTTAMTITSGMGSGNNSANSLTGDNLWSNIYSLGSLVSGTTLDVYQNDTQITPWWSSGQIDILIKVIEADVEIDSGNLTVIARQYGTLYDHFVIDASTGRNPVPLASFDDGNNDTASGTVGAYSGFTFTYQYASKDLNNGNSAQPYDCVVECNDHTILEVYEYLKYVTRTGSSTTLNGVNGEFYTAAADIRFDYTGESNGPFVEGSAITSSAGGSGYIVSLLDSGTTGTLTVRNVHGTFADTNTVTSGSTTATISGTPSSYTQSKQSPFGTFAGGQFFGARGVWLENVADADANNYVLIDSTGTTQSPPNTVLISVNGVQNGDKVSVFRAEDDAGTIDKTYIASHASSNSAGSTTWTAVSIPTDTPSTGFVRLRKTATQVEERIAYTERTSTTFTLSSAHAGGYGATDTAYVPYIDDEVTGTSISVSVTFDAIRNITTRVRKKGIVPFVVNSIPLNSSGYSATAVRIDDNIA